MTRGRCRHVTLIYKYDFLIIQGVITRESVRRALGAGITAEQIIHFLKTHAHPEMSKSQKGGIIPGGYGATSVVQLIITLLPS